VIFLVHYDRTAGRLVEIREFSDKDRELASVARLDLEIRLLSTANGHEVVLLEAPSEDVLRNTHRRYFETFENMKSSPKE
jgi:hypothetical protein